MRGAYVSVGFAVCIFAYKTIWQFQCKVWLRWIWIATFWTFTRQLWNWVHCGHNFCCCSKFAHTHTHTQTQKRKHVFQKIFCNNVPNITLFSKFIKNNSTFIWSVLYLTVVHNLKNPGSEIPALAKGRFSSLKPSSPNLQPSYPPIQLLLVSHLGGKAVGAWLWPLTPI